MGHGTGGARPSPAQDWARALAAVAAIEREPGRTLADRVDDAARAHGGRPALIGEAGTLTYADLAARANRCARWALARGLGRGDRVALLMPNGPEYLALWLGLGRVGVAAALLNTALTGAALAHAVRASGARHAVVAPALRAGLAAAFAGAADGPATWVHGAGADAGPADFEADLAARSDAPLRPGEGERPALADAALLVYTSGTTGLPKAALVSHRRVLEWCLWFAGLADVGPADRMYLCLPMYHSVGGVVAPGALLARGGSVVIRARFSASRFWPDVTASGATLFQYIGELCRYLADAPPHPDEARHTLRLCLGNGLAEAPWRAFAARFPGLRVLEFYASTEGNLSLYNCEGEVGAVGRVPPLLAGRFPLVIAACDPDGELLRGPDGLCRPCAPGEPGEALGLIASSDGRAGRPFEGYTDAAASARKVARDVREPGDQWFRTGDLMARDARGFVRFVERLGDTFRWKGENVSCAEVAGALRAAPGVREAVVYGVAVPGREGRAGMAALAVGPGFEAAALHAAAVDALPAYARPVFLRVGARLPLTGTFKPALGLLREAGFDPARSGDPILAFDRASGGYVPLDAAAHARIAAGDWPC